MGLKLASFAGLGQNGIADTTPVSGHGNISGCKQCQKEIDKTVDQLLMWETMQFCCETCL
ncbi:Putative LOC101855726, partial [Caligus rogercresseyi]